VELAIRTARPGSVLHCCNSLFATVIAAQSRLWPAYLAPAASQSSKVVGAMRAFSPGNITLPTIDSPKTPDQVGTSFTLRPRTSRVAWSRPHPADLVQVTGETANMAVLDGTMAVRVAQALRVKMSRFGHYGAYAAGALSRSGLHFRPVRSDSGAGQCGSKPGDKSIENLDQLG
jgi:hypothetical protein